MPPSSRPTTREKGAASEERAAQYLEACGLRVLHKNYRFRGGEIDLIAEEGATLCFIEVRSRSSAGCGSALETIDGRKQAHIAAAAVHYLQRRGGAPCACRFDVVAIDGSEIRWVRDAFQVR